MACVRKRRNRYVIDFYDQSGRRRWETLPEGTTRKEANEVLGEIERKVRQGNYIPAKRLPLFSEVADAWHASKDVNIRHSTSSQYKGHIEKHLKPFYGTSRINGVTFDQIEKFKAHGLSQGVTVPRLRKILTYAVRMRYIDSTLLETSKSRRGRVCTAIRTR
jgi:integrase